MQRRQSSNSGPVRRPERSGVRSRSGSRPAAARRAAVTGAAKRTTAPSSHRGLTGRATALLVVLAALALAYAYPVRIYLTQLAEIDAMTQAQIDQRSRIGELEEEAAKWQDEEYVRAQARSRLFYVYPGEIPLVPVFAPEPSDDDAKTGQDKPSGEQPWYGTLWSSLTEANAEPDDTPDD